MIQRGEGEPGDDPHSPHHTEGILAPLCLQYGIFFDVGIGWDQTKNDTPNMSYPRLGEDTATYGQQSQQAYFERNEILQKSVRTFAQLGLEAVFSPSKTTMKPKILHF